MYIGNESAVLFSILFPTAIASIASGVTEFCRAPRRARLALRGLKQPVFHRDKCRYSSESEFCALRLPLPDVRGIF